MGTNIKFSDLIRYILLGCISSVIVFLTINCILSGTARIQGESDHTAIQNILASIDSLNASVSIVLMFAVFFIAGVVVQGMRLWLLQSVRRATRFPWVLSMIETLYGNHRHDRWYFTALTDCIRAFVIPTYFYDKNNYARVLKFKKDNNEHVPRWVYISDHPEVLSDVIYKIISVNSHSGEDDREYLSDFLTSFLMIVRICFLSLFLFNFTRFPNVWKLELSLMALGILLVIWSKAYSGEYIRNLGVSFRALSKKEPEMADWDEVILSQGAPKVYVLIRTKATEPNYLRDTLLSVESQTYRNLQIIVLEDVDSDCVDKDGRITAGPSAIAGIVKEFTDRDHHPSVYERLQYSRKYCGGPAGAILEVRNIFLKTAGPNDIAVILDDDDRFRRERALEDIVYAMNRGQANICLTSFETKGDIEMDITNNGGRTHNSLISRFSRRSIMRFDPALCYASSIGWTKACRFEIVDAYAGAIRSLSLEQKFRDLGRYEDFPDLFMLLMKNAVVTGVPDATHSYYKREGRITTVPRKEDFTKARAGFLAFLLHMVSHSENMLQEGAAGYAKEFVLFKTCQIEDIYHKHFGKDKDYCMFTFTDALWKETGILSSSVRDYFGFKDEEGEGLEEFRQTVLTRMTALTNTQPDGSPAILTLGSLKND